MNITVNELESLDQAASYINILMGALQDAVNKIPKWIPVNEKVPDKRENYLITAEHGNYRFVEIAEYNNIFDEWYYHGSEDCDVIAWMPIIKPYKEE